MPDATEIARVQVDVVCEYETRLSFGFPDPKRPEDTVWLRKEDVRWPGRGYQRGALRTIEIPKWLQEYWEFKLDV